VIAAKIAEDAAKGAVTVGREAPRREARAVGRAKAISAD
jgi:hypothetical protein